MYDAARWIANNPEVTGYPNGTRLSHVLKAQPLRKQQTAKKKGEANVPPKYIWLEEGMDVHEDYTAITAQHFKKSDGELVPAVMKVFSDFKLFGLLQAALPEDELMKHISNLDVVPSVTMVPSFLLRDDGLQRWKAGQMLDWLHNETGGTLPSGEEWAALKRACANWRDDSYAKTGSRWHGAIEQHLNNEAVTTLDDAEQTIFQVAWHKIAEHFGGLDGDTERTFVHESGYGGTVDFRAGNVVIDWKTKHQAIRGKRGGLLATVVRPEHPVQLAAYAHGLGIQAPRLINVYISLTDGDVEVVEYKHPDHALQTWQTMLGLWYGLSNSKLKEYQLYTAGN